MKQIRIEHVHPEQKHKMTLDEQNTSEVTPSVFIKCVICCAMKNTNTQDSDGNYMSFFFLTEVQFL